MSVNRKVTVPVGSAPDGPVIVDAGSYAAADPLGQRREHRHRGLWTLAQDRLEADAVDDQPADIAVGDDRGRAGLVAEHRQLADVIAGGVRPDVLAVGPDDPDAALDDHDELLVGLSLADERLAARIEVLGGAGGDPLEVLRRELG